MSVLHTTRSFVCDTSHRETFSKLNEAQRRGILGPPVVDISRMLEQNLLNRFKEAPGIQLRLGQQRREELGKCQECRPIHI